MAGVPVLATGRFEGVVQTGVNGYLVEPFDADQFAARLDYLRSDTQLWTRMSNAGQELGRARFGGSKQTEQFTIVVERLVRQTADVAA